ncbi:MAG: signal peptidase I [Rhodospirillales bacterium]|nr:signal peptidase I [Rhodospirillales bacterium]
MDQRKPSGFRETATTVIYAILIALAVRTIAYEPFNIPSGSMIPTLLVGDYLFVSKFSYGYSRYSLPFSLPLIPERILFTPPERGDVMVFKLPTFVNQDSLGNFVRVPRYLETLPNGRKHYILEVTENSVFDNTPVYKVPEGHYFAMGDNRDRSRDSRFLNEVGYIPAENLIGRASVNGSVWEIWKWPKSLRFDRLFQGIE